MTDETRVVTPHEVKVLDMALRYSIINHDYGCPEGGRDPYDFRPCTCSAKDYREASITLLRRLSEGLKKPSGDYLDQVQP